MDQGNITLTSLTTLLDADKKPWVGVTGDACVVCGDRASGRHYGAISCEGCKGFFKRSIRKQLGYSCRGTKQCEVTKHHRNRCQYCRLQKCLQMGMRSDSVQHERKPLSNNQAQKREITEAALGSLSPSSIYGNILDGNAFNNRSGYLVYDNSYQDDEESESANESDSVERTTIAKAIEAISNVITDGKDDGSSSPVFSGIDKDTIIPEEWAQFVLVGPTNIPNNGLVNLTYVCETASRLLFLSIHWARSLPAFQALNSETRLSIMKAAWSDLFAVGLVQSQNLLPLTSVVSALLIHLQTSCTSNKLTTVAEYVSKLKVFIKSTQSLTLDDFEYSSLKVLALFSPDRYAQFDSISNGIREIQKSVLKQLQEHIISIREDSVERLNSILLLLPQLRAVDSAVIEEIFFSSVLGTTQIESVIPYILRMEADLSFPSSMNLETSINENSNEEQRIMLTMSG